MTRGVCVIDEFGDRHDVTLHWDAHGGDVQLRTCSCGESWTHDQDSCPVVDPSNDLHVCAVGSIVRLDEFYDQQSRVAPRGQRGSGATELDDDGTHPPCSECDEPVAVDPDGHEYSMCSRHLLEMSEPHERAQRDPDEVRDARMSERWAS